MRSEPRFFQVGGPLDEDSPSYIERPADEELLRALDRGELCLVLAPPANWEIQPHGPCESAIANVGDSRRDR